MTNITFNRVRALFKEGIYSMILPNDFILKEERFKENGKFFKYEHKDVKSDIEWNEQILFEVTESSISLNDQVNHVLYFYQENSKGTAKLFKYPSKLINDLEYVSFIIELNKQESESLENVGLINESQRFIAFTLFKDEDKICMHQYVSINRDGKDKEEFKNKFFKQYSQYEPRKLLNLDGKILKDK